MRILIGCECSGALRSRFRNAGFDAWSCDLKPAEDDPTHHCKMDVLDMIQYHLSKHDKWDLIILHPDCTAMAVSGNHVYAAGKPKHHMRKKSIEWTLELWHHAIKYSHRVAMENPTSVLFSTMKKQGIDVCYTQPYEHGDCESKRTGFALHNLSPLKPTNRVVGRIVNGVERFDNQTDSGQNKLGPSAQRATDRARTYPGIADAIVDQWGRELIDNVSFF